MSKKQLVTITGATGFLGINLCRIMSELGTWKVRAMTHSWQYRDVLKELDVEVVSGDVCNLDSLNNAFKGSDVVVHAASLISLIGDKKGQVSATNIMGAANVARAATNSRIRRLIHVSSIHAIEHDQYTLYVDENLPRAINHPLVYNRTKSRGEMAIRENIGNQSEFVIVNPTGIIGPYDYRPSHMGVALRRIYLGTLPMVPKAGFDWVDVRDVCKGIIKAIKKGKSGENYLLSGNYHSLLDIVRLLTRAKGKETSLPQISLRTLFYLLPFLRSFEVITRSMPQFSRESLLHLKHSNTHISHAKAKKELGYEPMSVRRSIEDTVAWFKEIKLGEK